MREVCSILNVEKLTTAAESPFQNGLCERNHAVVDTMLQKMCFQNPKTSHDVLLCWANMAKNSLQMWHGFSSFQLVFGKNPNLPNIMTAQAPALEGTTSSEVFAKHLASLHSARHAFIESEAEERIKRALRNKIRASEQVYNPGDHVFYKREAQDRWLGPAKVIFQDGKVIFVRHGSVFVRVSPNRLCRANSFDSTREATSEGETCVKSDSKWVKNDSENMVMPQVLDDECEFEFKTTGDMAMENGDCDETNNESDDSDRIETIENNASSDVLTDVQQMSDVNLRKGCDMRAEKNITRVIDLKQKQKIQVKNVNEKWDDFEIVSRGGKITGGHPNWFNARNNKGELVGINLDECKDWRTVESVNVVSVPRDKHHIPACVKAKREELKKLKSFDTYEEVEDEGQFRISTTWVLWLKGESVRARLVARGFEDQENVQKDSPTIGKMAFRAVITVAGSMEWEIKTTDIKSAFLQGKKLEREVYIQPPVEAGTKNLWKLKRCLYGLNDAARQFYQSVVECLKLLECTQSSLDPALFYASKDGKLIGIVACHVDDFLHAGTGTFEHLVMEKLRERFLAGKIEGGNFRYVGFNIIQDKKFILLDQSEYVFGIKNAIIQPDRVTQKTEPLTPKEQKVFRQLVGRINWAVQGSRPDMAFELIDLSTKLKQANVEDLTRASKCVNHLKLNVSVVCFRRLSWRGEWRIVLFTDAAWANLENCGSVGGHICFVEDCEGYMCPISWNANKIKRVVRSTLAAEMLSLQQGLEDALYARAILTDLLQKTPDNIPIVAYVDNKSVVEALGSTRMVDDKRLRVDVAAIKETLEKGEISNIQWVPGENQIADCLTKRGSSGYKLMNIMQSGKLQK